MTAQATGRENDHAGDVQCCVPVPGEGAAMTRRDDHPDATPKIVVGYDGSANAEHALGWAIRQAALQHGTLTVLAVNEVAASPWTGNPAVMPQDTVMLQQARTAAEDAVTKAAHELGDAEQPSVTVTARNGFATEELISASRDADLLVVGSRGQLTFPALRLGTTSAKIAHSAECPLVLVPPAN
jgi:nucleotide-binding universal stress UspA family protein